MKDIFKPGSKIRYSKEDLEEDSIFEEVENSRSMFVPSYNPSNLFLFSITGQLSSRGLSAQEIEKTLRDKEFEHRKRDLFSELENEIVSPRNFLMCHFHFTDWMHHLYGDKEVGLDLEKLRKVYSDIDNLAGEIRQKGEEAGYEYIIFMSDHGLPSENEHNENAFYSCNRKLFGEDIPKITDFHDRFLELTGNEDKVE